MAHSHRQSLPKSFLVASRGIFIACREQRNLKIHLAATVCVNLLAWLLHLSSIEWIVLWGVIGNVLAVELLNTAIETAVDLASPEQHPLAGQAKDIAAGAVLIISLIAAGIGLAIFLPHVIHLLS